MGVASTRMRNCEHAKCDLQRTKVYVQTSAAWSWTSQSMVGMLTIAFCRKKTGRGSLLNCLPYPWYNPVGQETELNWTLPFYTYRTTGPKERNRSVTPDFKEQPFLVMSPWVGICRLQPYFRLKCLTESSQNGFEMHFGCEFSPFRIQTLIWSQSWATLNWPFARFLHALLPTKVHTNVECYLHNAGT